MQHKIKIGAALDRIQRRRLRFVAFGGLAALLILSLLPYWRNAGWFSKTTITTRWLADRKGSGIFYRVSPDGKRERILLADSSDTYLVDISPDGQRLVFFSNREGDSALWTVPLESSMPSGSPTHIVDLSAITSLGFARDGALYFYLGNQDAATFPAAYLAKINPDAKITLSPPRRVMSHQFAIWPPQAWSNEGQPGFFAQKIGQSAVKPLIIVQSAEGSFSEIPTKFRWQSLNWRTGHSIVGFGISEGREGYYEVDFRTAEIDSPADPPTIGTRKPGGVLENFLSK